MPRDITEVKRVIEIGLHDERHGMNLHSLLDEGWLLLNVHSVSIDSDHGNSQRAMYSLGWPYEEEPPSEIAFEKAASAARLELERIRATNREQGQDC